MLAERPGYAEFEDRKFRSTSPALYAPLATSFTNAADRLDDLEGLPDTLPTLVIVGEQDQPFLGPSERMAKAIPDASLVVIPDAGHSPQFENPEAWWTALSGFLAGSARLTGHERPVRRAATRSEARRLPNPELPGQPLKIPPKSDESGVL